MMENKCTFFNPVMKSPWESSAPKIVQHKPKHKLANNENNSSRAPSVTRYMFRHDLQYHNIGFHAHSGHYHTYYQTVKRALFEEQLKKYQNSRMMLHYPVATCPEIVNPIDNSHKTLRELNSKLATFEPIEVIDITDDSPPTTPKRSPSSSANTRAGATADVQTKEQFIKKEKASIRKPKSPKRFVKIRPKDDLLAPTLNSTGCKPEDTTYPVGVVISKKSAGYVVRLL